MSSPLAQSIHRRPQVLFLVLLSPPSSSASSTSERPSPLLPFPLTRPPADPTSGDHFLLLLRIAQQHSNEFSLSPAIFSDRLLRRDPSRLLRSQPPRAGLSSSDFPAAALFSVIIAFMYFSFHFKVLGKPETTSDARLLFCFSLKLLRKSRNIFVNGNAEIARFERKKVSKPTSNTIVLRYHHMKSKEITNLVAKQNTRFLHRSPHYITPPKTHTNKSNILRGSNRVIVRQITVQQENQEEEEEEEGRGSRCQSSSLTIFFCERTISLPFSF
ncbi:mothers against decapentaplegic homolog 4 [Striga asiatica]|uniref:Mothers against decapentaplegic homolog 4 n=1 Tax=Striga asiatica TaxID=4170 RepID=A0A5A7PU61_STRAF|nr:mothers against decapentaplegic homolog 4 [Striga asiatica]